MKPSITAFLTAALLAATAFIAAPSHAADATPTLHPKAAPLPFTHQGPFVTTGDGDVLCLDAKNALRSRDEGQTWSTTPVFADAAKYTISNERALLRTRDGVIIAAWMNGSRTKVAQGLELGRQGRELGGFRAADLRVPQPRRRKDVGGTRHSQQAVVRLHSLDDRNRAAAASCWWARRSSPSGVMPR